MQRFFKIRVTTQGNHKGLPLQQYSYQGNHKGLPLQHFSLKFFFKKL